MRRRAALAAALSLTAAPLGATLDRGAAYDLSIAGVPVGEARIAIAADGGAYAVDAAADVGFLFWGGAGSARAEGAQAPGALSPALYRLAYEGVTRPGAVSIHFDGARAVRWESAPPPSPEYAEGRVEVMPRHLEGVLDPLTALVIPAPADIAPAVLCARVLPVFNGYTRFDLALTGGAAGPGGAVSCTVRYMPVAGHREGSASVARMTQPGAVTLSLRPLAPGFWGPDRVGVSTRFGTFEMARRG